MGGPAVSSGLGAEMTSWIALSLFAIKRVVPNTKENRILLHTCNTVSKASVMFDEPFQGIKPSVEGVFSARTGIG